MKPDYKNWIPKGNDVFAHCGTVLSLALLLVFVVFGIGVSGKLRVVLGVVFGVAFVVCAKYTEWCVMPIGAFPMTANASSQSRSLTVRRSISHSRRVAWELDIGCGSDALTIACAKRNPQGKMVGIDRWGQGIRLLQSAAVRKNAAAESVKNASFQHGERREAGFSRRDFDAVTSNYVYHNITGADKQAHLLETLRVLKKGRNVCHPRPDVAR